MAGSYILSNKLHHNGLMTDWGLSFTDFKNCPSALSFRTELPQRHGVQGKFSEKAMKIEEVFVWLCPFVYHQ